MPGANQGFSPGDRIRKAMRAGEGGRSGTVPRGSVRNATGRPAFPIALDGWLAWPRVASRQRPIRDVCSLMLSRMGRLQLPATRGTDGPKADRAPGLGTCRFASFTVRLCLDRRLDILLPEAGCGFRDRVPALMATPRTDSGVRRFAFREVG